MDANNVLMTGFVNKLTEYIASLDRRIADMESKYASHTYLLQNYRYQGASIVDAISSIPIDKVCELLATFEDSPRYSKLDIENALSFCKICEKNPKFKEHERYKELSAILDYVHQVFSSHIFRNQSEVNAQSIEDTKLRRKKFTDLQRFVTGELHEYELEDLESYRIEFANYSDEEWLQIYFQLTTLQIENYKRKEDRLRDEIEIREEQRRQAMADALQEKIMNSLPKEEADIIKPTVVDSTPVEVEEDIADPEIIITPPVTEEGKTLLSDEKVSRLYGFLQEKYRAYRSYGSITPTKKSSFKLNFDALISGTSNLDYMRIAYNDSDYKKFLFFCFYEIFTHVANDVQERYTEDYEDLVEVIIDDMIRALDYMTLLENELYLDDKDLEDEQPESVPTVEQKPYKLVFYDNGNSSEFEKSIKGMTPEKISEIATLLSRLEEGRLENAHMLKKKVAFRFIVGQFTFLTFRTLSNGHIMVYAAGSLEELNNNKIDNRLVIYDLGLEKKIASIIKDNTLEYRKLMKKSDGIKEMVYSQGLNKGV